MEVKGLRYMYHNKDMFINLSRFSSLLIKRIAQIADLHMICIQSLTGTLSYMYIARSCKKHPWVLYIKFPLGGNVLESVKVCIDTHALHKPERPQNDA